MRRSLKNAILLALFFFLSVPAFASQTVHRHLEPETVIYNALPSAAQTQFTTNENIKSIKYGSGITLASVTANFSLVDGTAFVTNPSVDLRAYVGFKLTTNDGSVGYVKAAGTGQTESAEQLSNGSDWTGGPPPTGWTATNCTLAAVAGGQGGSGNCLQITRTADASQYANNSVIGFGAGALGHFSAYVKTGSSGNEGYQIGAYDGMYTATLSGTSSAAWVQASGYMTLTTGLNNITMFLLKNSATAGTMLFDTATLKKVLTPLATGCTIVSTQGGTTYNWITKGTTPNAASFTLTFTRN